VTGARLLDYGELKGEVWDGLSTAARSESHPFHLVTLATVGADRRPAARTMAVRGANLESRAVYLHADRRSPKIGELRGNPCACLLALDRARSIQVRFSGLATIHEHDALADEHWRSAGRAAWWTPELTPTQARPHLPVTFERMPAPLTRQARDHFAVIEVSIEHIDWFQAAGGRVRCAALCAADGWAARIVPP
jgi:pyridoxamine 5'-phosphate oxidase